MLAALADADRDEEDGTAFVAKDSDQSERFLFGADGLVIDQASKGQLGGVRCRENPRHPPLAAKSVVIRWYSRPEAGRWQRRCMSLSLAAREIEVVGYQGLAVSRCEQRDYEIRAGGAHELLMQL
jgi:hypothetical protein